MRSPLLLVALCSLALAGCATTGAPAPIIASGEIPLERWQNLSRALSSDEFEGRAPGTRGEELTLAALAEAFADAGLQPDNRGSWFQDVPLVEITGHSHAPFVVRGASGPAIALAFSDDWAGVTYREAEEITLPASEIVFVGYGINAPERGWNDYAGIDMTGKIALILVNDPDYASETLDGPFGGRAMTYYGRWTYKFEEAARQGAAAALIVHDTFPAAYGWNVVQSGWTGPQSRARTADGGASEALLNGWVQLDAARRITAAAGQDLDALMEAARQPGFRAVPLGLTGATSFANTIRPYASRNVIGILPGRGRADEYVLHTAHWDHMGRCPANAAGDDICNGAIDNAVGTAALAALAEAHAKAGPTARTQVFLAVTAEESGLLGSEYYGANPVFPLESTAGGLNIDALFVSGEARDVIAIGAGKSELDDYLSQALATQGRRLSPDTAPQAGRYYRSDHFSMAKRGVPMLYLKSGIDLIEGGEEAGLAWGRAYDAVYHGPDDEFDESWDWRGAMRDLQLYFTLGRMLGDSTDWPNWREGDEFRQVRDAACAAARQGC